MYLDTCVGLGFLASKGALPGCPVVAHEDGRQERCLAKIQIYLIEAKQRQILTDNGLRSPNLH